jgi:hypothetical protein
MKGLYVHIHPANFPDRASALAFCFDRPRRNARTALEKAVRRTSLNPDDVVVLSGPRTRTIIEALVLESFLDIAERRFWRFDETHNTQILMFTFAGEKRLHTGAPAFVPDPASPDSLPPQRYFVQPQSVGESKGVSNDDDLTLLLDRWQGDSLVSAGLTFFLTEPACLQLKRIGARGYRTKRALTVLRKKTKTICQQADLPPFFHLRPSNFWTDAPPGRDDLTGESSTEIVVSERAMAVLQQCGLKHAKIRPFRSPITPEDRALFQNIWNRANQLQTAPLGIPSAAGPRQPAAGRYSTSVPTVDRSKANPDRKTGRNSRPGRSL